MWAEREVACLVGMLGQEPMSSWATQGLGSGTQIPGVCSRCGVMYRCQECVLSGHELTFKSMGDACHRSVWAAKV